MPNTIQHKRNSTSGATPSATGLAQGELGINIADGRLYTKNSSNVVINLGVTSISGTSITPASGNFSSSLKVNGIEVSVSGHNHDRVTSAGSLTTAVFNKTSSTIPKFSVVYINGGQGDQPTINLAIASNEAGSSKTYGVTSEAISSMGTGIVVVAGALTGVNTDQFNPTAPVGDVNGSALWLSPSVSGSVTLTKPTAPNHMVYVGTIIRTHQNEGVVEVRVQNGFELEELHNVAISGVTNGQFLQYNSGSGLWIPTSSGNFTTLNVNSTGVVVSSGGAAGYLGKFTNSSSLNNSIIYQSGNNIGIGTTVPSEKLAVSGNIHVMGGNIIGNTSIVTGSGSVISYTHPDNVYANDYDTIIPGALILTRGNGGGIYNLVLQSIWDSSGPSNTLWNNDGWSNITNIKTRTYDTLMNTVGGNLGYNLPNVELIMKHVPTERYWKIKFSSWTQYGGGGFAYTRQEIYFNTIFNSGLCVRNDGSVGIGTNSPFSKLHVSGDVRVDGVGTFITDPYVLAIDVSGAAKFGAGLYGSIYFGDDRIGGELGFTTDYDEALALRMSDGSYHYGGGNYSAGNLVVASGGNVGMGTVSPSAKLDVQGSFNVYSDPENLEGSSINCSNNGIILSTFGSAQTVDIQSATEGDGVINIGNAYNDTTNLNSTFTNINGWAFDGDIVTNINGNFTSSSINTYSTLNIANDPNNGTDLTDWKTIISNGTIHTYHDIGVGFNGMGYNVSINGNGGITGGASVDIAGSLSVSTSGAFSSGVNISSQTASTIASFDSNKNIVSLSTGTYPSLTELSYIKGVTSGIQIQLNNKQTTLINPVTGTGTASYVPKWSSASGLSNSLIYDNGTNVGIGTMSPSTQLHVIGTGNFTQALQVNGTGVSISGHTHTSSDISNFNSSVSGLLPTISNSGDNRVLTSTGSSLGINAESNLTFDGSLLTITGSGSIASGLFLTDQTASTIASFDSNKKVVSLSTGTYPSLTELSYVKGVTSAIQTQLNNKQNTITNPVTGTGIINHIAYWSSSSDIIADSGQLVWDSTNNRLGIGVSSPTSVLHVIGNSILNGDVSSTGSFIAGSGTALLPSFKFVNDPDTGLFSPAANTFGISTSGVERLRVNNIGNIGINNSSPTTTLQVNGSFSCGSPGNDPISGGQGLYVDPVTPILRLIDSGPNYAAEIGVDGLTLYDIASNDFFNTDRSNGRIGIGTASPEAELDVQPVNGGNGTIKCNYIASNILLSYNDWASGVVGDVTIGDLTTLSHINWTIDADGNASFGLVNGNSLGAGSFNGLTITDNSPTNISIDSGPYDLVLAGDGAIDITSAVSNQINLNGNVTFTSYTESVVANGNSGTSKTLSLTSGTVHTCTLTGNCTFTMPTATAGKSFTLFLNSGAGNYTATFTGVRWADSATPTATITASKVDIYSFISDGTYWYGSFSQNYG